jgi:hypothetical protein
MASPQEQKLKYQAIRTLLHAEFKSPWIGI